MSDAPLFRSAFKSIGDGESGQGHRPVVIDILGPDRQTSLLPDEYKMVLHVNPKSMRMNHQKVVARQQTMGGWVEQHFGDGTETIDFEFATGAFMRLYSGLTSVTGGGLQTEMTRRDTIAYDKFLDLLALFHSNGMIYDSNQNILVDGIIKVMFDSHSWFGWFNDFSWSEEAESPYQFTVTTTFTISFEDTIWRTTAGPPYNVSSYQNPITEQALPETAVVESEDRSSLGFETTQREVEAEVAAGGTPPSEELTQPLKNETQENLEEEFDLPVGRGSMFLP